MVTLHRSYVLSGFRCSRFDCIQPATSLTHPDTFVENSSTCDGEHEPFSAEAPPRTPLGEFTTLPQIPNRLGRGTLPLHSHPFPLSSSPSVSRSRRGASAPRLPVGIPRCEVRRTHQNLMVNPALLSMGQIVCLWLLLPSQLFSILMKFCLFWPEG